MMFNFFSQIHKGNIPVDTGRKRPGHLLNILCTLSLRPVSAWIKIIYRIVKTNTLGNANDLLTCLLRNGLTNETNKIL